jgi:hypothetical protein
VGNIPKLRRHHNKQEMGNKREETFSETTTCLLETD